MVKKILLAIALLTSTNVFAQGTYRLANRSSQPWTYAIKHKFKTCALLHTTGNSCNIYQDEQRSIGWYTVQPGDTAEVQIAERGTCIALTNQAGIELYYLLQQHGLTPPVTTVETLNATNPLAESFDFQSYADPFSRGKVGFTYLKINGISKVIPRQSLSAMEVLNVLVANVMLPFKCTLAAPGNDYTFTIN